ncbi:major facilitator superfamily domain-containing protein 8-like isoform X1 [Rhopilema esculentum]|uniref:major facilitator superfamily domain-containing protein 8-like isoform X1 n=1 Tax=Rhopilema esculentum TaxID=499914 RepID=UPI0031D6B8F0
MEKKKLLNAARDSVANETKQDDQHETPEEYKSRWRTIRITYLTMTLSAMEFSIILPSIWPYLQKVDQEVNAQFLGLVVTGYGIFQVIGSILFGAWCQYRPAIEPLLASASLRFIGNFLYLCAENYPGFDGKMLILFARLTIGFSAGDIAVCRTVVSQSAAKYEKNNALKVIVALEEFGSAMGPALQAVAVPLLGKGLHYSFVNIDIFNIAGWIGIVMAVFRILITLIWFKEHNIDVKDSTGDLPKPNLRAALVTILAFFVLYYDVSIIETVTSPLLGDEFALRKDEAVLYAGTALSSLSIIILAAYIIIRRIQNRFRERTILFFGFLVLLLAFVILLPWGSERHKLQTKELVIVGNVSKIVLSPGCPIKYNWCKTTPKIRPIQFAIGIFFVFVGFAMPQIIINLLYSKIIGPRKQGLYMASFSCAGSFGDLVGPLVTTSLYAHFGPRGLFLCAAIVNLITATMLAGFYTS